MKVRIVGRILAVAALAWLFCDSSAVARRPDVKQLDREHKHQRKHLKATFDAHRDAIRYDYTETLRQIRCARKNAIRLCEPQRSRVLHELNHRRRAAVRDYHFRLRQLNEQEKLARGGLETDYRYSRKSLRGQAHCEATCHPMMLEPTIHHSIRPAPSARPAIPAPPVLPAPSALPAPRLSSPHAGVTIHGVHDGTARHNAGLTARDVILQLVHLHLQGGLAR